MRTVLAVLFVAAFTISARAETPSSITPGTIQCTKGSKPATRAVELKSTGTGGCQVLLTRNGGEPSVVAHAEHQLQLCTDIREKVVTNLKDAGFTCGEGVAIK